MRLVSTRSNNAETQNLGDNLGRFSGAVNTIASKLVGGQALSVEGAEAGLVTEQRTPSHGHAAGKQNFDGGIQPKDRNASSAEKLGAAGLRVSSATERKNGSLFEFGSAAERGAELVGFELAEIGLPQAFENLRDGEAGRFLDAVVEIDKTPGKLARQERANGGLTGTHEAGEAKNRHTR